jgi:hypothetical protein
MGRRSREVRRRVLDILALFLWCLPRHFHPAATAVLVAGNEVEFTAELTDDMPDSGGAMLIALVKDPQGLARMCAHGVVDRLLKWISHRLLKVRLWICW